MLTVGLALAVAAAAQVSYRVSHSAESQGRLPIIDTHIHYNLLASKLYEPAFVRKLMRDAGVTRALVSSWPDEGTLKLADALPGMILPSYSLYIGGIINRNWTRYPDDVLPRMRQRLAQRTYRGIGEIHIYNVNKVDWQVIEKVVALARKYDIFLHVHCQDDAIRRLYVIDPELKILWAHAGLVVKPETVQATMDQFPTLMTELSLRAINIMAEDDEQLKPAWRALLMTHQDRLMIGSDTYMNISWVEYGDLIGAHRRWLAQLPRITAEKIAHKNARRFFNFSP